MVQIDGRLLKWSSSMSIKSKAVKSTFDSRSHHKRNGVIH